MLSYSPTDEYSAITHYISIKAAEYLNNVVIDGTILGVSWGSTIYEVARQFADASIKGSGGSSIKGRN